MVKIDMQIVGTLTGLFYVLAIFTGMLMVVISFMSYDTGIPIGNMTPNRWFNAVGRTFAVYVALIISIVVGSVLTRAFTSA